MERPVVEIPGDFTAAVDAVETAAGQRRIVRPHLVAGRVLTEFEIVGEAQTPRDGVARARQAIDSGAARRTLESIASFGARGAA